MYVKDIIVIDRLPLGQ